MKRTGKTIMALLTAVTITMGAVGVTAYAETKTDKAQIRSIGGWEEDVLVKTYVYEKEGLGSPFTIELGDNGKYAYYEGELSSYIETGKWEQTEDIITLTAETGKSVNRFKVKGSVLIFIADESDNFYYVKAKDGDQFTLCSSEANSKAETEPVTNIEPAKVLPNTLEQLVSKDGTFTNNELIYSDKYKFAVENLPADPDRGLPERDVLVVYDIPYEDTTGMSEGEWKKHISINKDYVYGDLLWLPGGPDRLIYSGCRYDDVTSMNKSFKLEKQLEIVFVVNGERPRNLYDWSDERIKSEYGFDIFKYVNFESNEEDTDAIPLYDEYTERQSNDLHQTYYKIMEYMGFNANGKDAVVSIHGWGDRPEDYIEIDYVTDKGREYAENFIKENDISMDRIEINEMERSQKCEYIALNIVNQFISINGLSCRVRSLAPTDNASTAYDGGIDIIYDAQNENDKKTVEEFITQRGYDKELPISYTLVDPEEMTIKNNDDTSPLEQADSIATIKGDANLDGTVDLADLTTIVKYVLSNSGYPLENDIAYANADMNGDGIVDGLDVSALIEYQLGK